MKEYYLYDSDFRDLERTGAFATMLFAASSGCLGFAADILVGIAFAENISPAVKAEWGAYRNVALVLAIVFFLFGTFLTLSGYNRVEQLKSQTSHGTETYVPRSRFRLALNVIVVIAAIGVGIFIGHFLLGVAVP